MPQQRYGEFGSLFNHAGIREVFKAVAAHNPRVVAGMVPQIEVVVPVPVDRFVIGAGWAITEDGVLVEFQETEEVVFGTPAVATQKTIVLRHTLEVTLGGNGAEVVLEDGLVKEAADSVVLGWIDYPGGNIPLVDDHITATTPMFDTPLNAKYLDTAYPLAELNAPHTDLYDDPTNDPAIVRTISKQDVNGAGFSYYVTEIENTNGVAAQDWLGGIMLRTKAINGTAYPFYHLRITFYIDGGGTGLLCEGSVEGAGAILFNDGQAAGVWHTESVDIPVELRPNVDGVFCVTFKTTLNAGSKLYIASIDLTGRAIPVSP